MGQFEFAGGERGAGGVSVIALQDHGACTVFDQPAIGDHTEGLNHIKEIGGDGDRTRPRTQIHIATWPGDEPPAPPAPDPVWPRQLLLSRAFASQAAAYVILAGGLLSAEDVPEAYQELMSYTNPGDSCIIDPRGEVIAGPVEGETILIADGSTEHIFAAKSACDVAGHYSRPDIFQLRVNQTPYQRVVETSGPEYVTIEPDSEQNSPSGGAHLLPEGRLTTP